MKRFKAIFKKLIVSVFLLFCGIYAYGVDINYFDNVNDTSFLYYYRGDVDPTINFEMNIRGTQGVLTLTDNIDKTLLKNGFTIKGGGSALFNGDNSFYGFEFIDYQYVNAPDVQIIFDGMSFINFHKGFGDIDITTGHFQGAVIYNVGESTVMFTGTTRFSGNLVEENIGDDNAQGGAIYNTGRLEFVNSGEIGIAFVKNKATTLGDGAAQGGAIFTSSAAAWDPGSGIIQEGVGEVLFSNSYVFFSGNEAHSGGAIYANFSSVTFDASAANFIANIATSSGGAIYTFGSTITFNSVAGKNILFSGNKMGTGADEISNDIFTQNSVLIFNADAGSSISLLGGIYSQDANVINKLGAGTLILGGVNYFDALSFGITQGAILVNKATFTYLNGNGFKRPDHIYFKESQVIAINNTATGNGGFLYAKEGGTYTFTNVDMSTNVANYGGAIYINNADMGFKGEVLNFSFNKANVRGGAIFLDAASKITFNSAKISFTSNTAIEDAVQGGGGAIYARTGSTVTFSGNGSIIEFTSNSASVYGGAIFVQSSLMSFNKSTITFIDNVAGSTAGAIFVDGSVSAAHLEFNSSIVNFTSNTAQYNAGAIYVSASNLKFNASTVNFTSNVAIGANGGAIYTQSNSTITFNKSTITFLNNVATSSGGAIYLQKSYASFDGSSISFTSNSAVVGDGGAIYAFSSTITFNSGIVSFDFNMAEARGGAIFAEDTQALFDSASISFSSNTANQEGGAIYAKASTLTFSGEAYFYGNQSALLGGAVYAENSSITFAATSGDIIFSGNSAFDILNDLYISASSLELQAFGGKIALYDGITAFDSIVSIIGIEQVYITSVNYFDSTLLNVKNGNLYVDNASFTYINSMGNNDVANIYGSTVTFINSTATFANNAGHAMKTQNSLITFSASSINFTDNISGIGGSGAIIAYDTFLLFDKSSLNFIGNVATEYSGGAIWAERSSTTFNDSFINFINNDAGLLAGAIGLYHSYMDFNNSTVNFINNQNGIWYSPASGGALYAEGSTLIFNNTKGNFSENKSITDAGAISANISSITFIVSTISFMSNTASANGGAIAALNTQISFINSSVSFSSNTSTTNGGAVYLDNSLLTFIDSQVNFTSNVLANGSTRGGAIYAGNGSFILFENSQVNFTSNIAGIDGGAIYAQGASHIIINSSTINFVGNVDAGNGNAGAVLIGDGSEFIVTNSLINFTSNSAPTAGAGALIASQGTRVEFNVSTVNFTGNLASLGGAVIVEAGGRMIFNDSIVDFTSNTAIADGGAIYVSGNDSNVSFSTSIVNFTSNSAVGNGGAIYADNSNISFSTSIVNFISNSVIGDGGAIYADNSNISFNTSIVNFTSNSAVGNGGAIYASDGANISFSSSIVNFINNSAESAGGVIYAQGAEISFSSSIVSFTSNSSESDGGVIYADDSYISFSSVVVDFSYNLSNDWGAITLFSSELNFRSSIVNFISNISHVVQGEGGAIYTKGDTVISFDSSQVNFTSNVAGARGGAIVVSGNDSNISFNSSTVNFTSNSANKDTLDDGGGAIHISGNSDISFNNSEVNFVDNVTAGVGGAIYALSEAEIKFNGSQQVNFINNTANNDGGAIYLGDESTLDIKNSSINFINNSAKAGNGGAIYAHDPASKILINNATISFVENKAGQDGGAIYTAAALEFAGLQVKFTSNAAQQGGAIYTKGDLSFIGSAIDFTGNKTQDAGGAIYSQGAPITFDNTVVNFSGNLVNAGNGGAIYTDGGEITFNNGSTVSFVGHSANEGGAIYANNADIYFNNVWKVYFSGNTSLSGNGVIGLNDSQILFTGVKELNVINNTAANGGFFSLQVKIFTEMSIEKIEMEGNKAVGINLEKGKGGALHFYGNNTVLLHSSDIKFMNNNATGDGGAIYVDADAALDISNAELMADSNKAEGNGGFIYVSKSATFRSEKSMTFSNNTGIEGGAIYVGANGYVALSGNGNNGLIDFTYNIANQYGGAIAAMKGGTATIYADNNSIISFIGNKGKEGGAIYIGENSQVILTANNGGEIEFEYNERTNLNAAGLNDISLDEGAILNLVSNGANSVITLNSGIASYSNGGMPNTSIIEKTGTGLVEIKGIVNFQGKIQITDGELKILTSNVELGELIVKDFGKFSTFGGYKDVDSSFALHITSAVNVNIGDGGMLEIGINISTDTSYSSSTVDIIYANNITIDGNATLNIRHTGVVGVMEGIEIMAISGSGGSINQKFVSVLINGQMDSKYDKVTTTLINGKVLTLGLIHSIPLPEIPELNHNQQEAANLLDKANWTKWTSVVQFMDPILKEASIKNYTFAKRALDDVNGMFLVNALKSGVVNRNSVGILNKVKTVINQFEAKYEEDIYNEVWLQGDFGTLRYKDSSEPYGQFKTDKYGVKAGANLYLDKGVVAGLFVGYNDNTIKQEFNRADMSEIEVGVYGGWWFDQRANVKANLGLGFQNYSSVREINYQIIGIDSAARPKADFDTYSIKLATELEYVLLKSNKISLKPFVGLDGGIITNKAIKETDGKGIELLVEAGNYVRLDSRFGLKLEDNYGKAKWYVKGYGAYLLVGKEAGYNIRYAKAQEFGKMEIWGTDEPELTIGAGLGLEYSLTSALSLTIDLDANYAEDKYAYNTGIGFGYKIGYHTKLRDRHKYSDEADLNTKLGRILSDKKMRWLLETNDGKEKEMLIADDDARKTLGLEEGNTIYVINTSGRIFYFEDRQEAINFIQRLRRAGANISVKAIAKVKIENQLVYPEGSKELAEIRKGITIKRYSNGLKEVVNVGAVLDRTSKRGDKWQSADTRDFQGADGLVLVEKQIIDAAIKGEIGNDTSKTVVSDSQKAQAKEMVMLIDNEELIRGVEEASNNSYYETKDMLLADVDEYRAKSARPGTIIGKDEVVEGEERPYIAPNIYDEDVIDFDIRWVEQEAVNQNPNDPQEVEVLIPEPINRPQDKLSNDSSKVTWTVRDYEELRIWELLVEENTIHLGTDLAKELGLKVGQKIFFVQFGGRKFLFGNEKKVRKFIDKVKKEGRQTSADMVTTGLVGKGFTIDKRDLVGIGEIKDEMIVVRYVNEEIEIMTKEESSRRDELEGIE